MREIFSTKTNFNFLNKTPLFIPLSALLIAASLYVWFSSGDKKYGVDFLGGNEFLIQMSEPTQTTDIRDAIEKGGLSEPIVQSFTGSNQYSIRLHSGTESDQSTNLAKESLTKALDASYKGKYDILRTDSVGPTVGAELRQKALWAIGLGLLAMLLYVAYRFEFAFGLGAVVAVFHDVIIATGIYLLLDHQINMSALAAAMTIVGYSMNDTIVIFDRVREELFRNRGNTNLSTLVNGSINFTLSRTLITHFLTFFAVLALYLFGGGELSDLSTFILAGIIVGSYSTIYVASPVMIWWHKLRGGTEQV